MNIADIDTNFKIETQIERPDIRFFDVEDEPFRLYGIMREDNRFCRLPKEVAKNTNQGVEVLYANTAGGRVRFVTDSLYVAISAKMDGITRFPHMALTATAGFDLYANAGEEQIYRGTFMPPYYMEEGYESVYDFEQRSKRLITINFPLYSNVKKLYIGLEEGATLEMAPDYTYEQPIVYYGSSITQGGCASRPGNTYQAIISRELDANFINLGFSGSAKAEKAITDYINTLDMRIFVLDYDHNAPTVEHLKETHEKMFLTIREQHPDLPIIIMSRPIYHLVDMEKERLEIVKTTYENAIARGDKKVYLLTGPDLIKGMVIETATVDNCHPNDSGFVSMAKNLSEVIKTII